MGYKGCTGMAFAWEHFYNEYMSIALLMGFEAIRRKLTFSLRGHLYVCMSSNAMISICVTLLSVLFACPLCEK